ncbi:MAG: NADP-dependent oxidoreductase [Carbonactinosporaceae bacterium]
MRVVEATAFGGPEVLRVAERRGPVPGSGEVLVRVRAATVNPTDLAARSGLFRSRMPDVRPPFRLGWDLAGDVVAAGSDVAGYQVGDRVVGMIPWPRARGRAGAYAELAVAEPEWLAPLGPGIDYQTAATLPLNALTARQALDMITPAEGSTLLVTGASGAVGGFAVQLALRDGCRVVAVAGRDDEDWVAGLGATEVLPRSVDVTRVGPVDAVLDAVPVGPHVAAAVRAGGTVIFTRPPRPPLSGSRARSDVVLVRPDPAALADLAADLASGRLRTRVAGTFELEDVRRAHERAEAGGLRGKLVLTP